MSTAGLLCRREVVICTRADTVSEAARRMLAFHVGDVVVVDERGGERHPVGMLTDRDIVIRVVAAGLDPQRSLVGSLMSDPLVTALESEPLDDVLPRMRGHGIRRLVVVNEQGVLEGILTLDDLLELLGEEMTTLARLVTRERREEEDRAPIAPNDAGLGAAR